MKVSRKWLQNFFDAPLPATPELERALMFHAFEVEGIERVGEDEILDIKVLNRGHDCLSHRGIAKELSAILKLPLNKNKDPFNYEIDFSKKAAEVKVNIDDTKLCKRYIAAHIKGVAVAPSPEWLMQALEAIGQRSINNIVDATNMVMFNTGQPLHAFDAGRLGSLDIGVRLARKGEDLEALDKKVYTLDPVQLVITAGDRPVGVAGVKGGEADRIDQATHDIVIESATFDGVAIRKSAQLLKLRTDASTRFEQVLSPELAAVGMSQVVDLIATLAGGELQGFVDVYPEPQKQTVVAIGVKKINGVLGTKLTAAEVADVFVRLGFAYKEERGVFEVQVPFERLDITIPEDLVEEVARIVGYDKIPATSLPQAQKPPEVDPNFAAAEAAREELILLGYSEVYTSVFAEQGERVVANKVDGARPYLRTSLIGGLNEALKKNIPNKDLLGLKEIKLFEIGTVWKGGKELMMVGKVSEKEPATEKPLSVQGESLEYRDLAVSKTLRYKNFSRYPYIVRDIAAWTPASTDAEQVQQTIQKEAGDLCERVYLFDTFTKDNRTSLAFRLIFQSFERTLTEAEANAAMEKVAAALKVQGFEIR